MKTSLVLNRSQIITNIKTIEKYLMGDSDNDFNIMAKYISHGRVFIAYKFDGDFHFAPSRFIGYANNTLERHKQNSDKYGTITTQHITRILGHSNIYSQELEDAYKTYCAWLGKQPSKNNRSYWCLEEEIPWEYGKNHFFEGGRKLVTHMKIERNSKVVAEAKSIFKRNHNNELYCEICGFNFGFKITIKTFNLADYLFIFSTFHPFTYMAYILWNKRLRLIVGNYRRL